MKIILIGGAVLAALMLAGIHASNSRLEETRARAAEASKATPKSAGDRRVISDNVVAYTTANEELKAARQKARDTLPRFVSLKKSGMKATFTVKFPLTQNGRTEHIWLEVSAMSDRAFIGQLANKPVNGAQYDIGAPMVVHMNDVEDWMVRTGNEIYGGYTARYQIKDLPKHQAERLAAMFRD
jgi:uncharacterized protein YegJ (DUF2314 family)